SPIVLVPARSARAHPTTMPAAAARSSADGDGAAWSGDPPFGGPGGREPGEEAGPSTRPPRGCDRRPRAAVGECAAPRGWRALVKSFEVPFPVELTGEPGLHVEVGNGHRSLRSPMGRGTSWYGDLRRRGQAVHPRGGGPVTRAAGGSMP